MKSAGKKSTLSNIIVLLRWGKVTAKIAALGTALTGAITTLTSSSTAAGIAMGAAGATTYAATKELGAGTYEKTKHVAPGLVKGPAADRGIIAVSKRKPVKSDAPVKPSPPKASAGAANPGAEKLPENPFAWTQEQTVSVPAEESQGAFAFYERPSVMLVTTEEEQEFDESGAKTKKIRRTALNFIAPEADAIGSLHNKDDGSEDPTSI